METVRILTLFIFVFTAFGYTTGQEVKLFKVITDDNITDIEKYETAIEKSNMEIYRNRSVSDTLHFDNGISFVLFSAEAIKQRGIELNINDYKNPEERGKRYIKPKFKLSPEGILLALYPRIEK